MKRALLVLLAACWSSPRPPGVAAIPGLVWMTERPPYRVSAGASALAIDGSTALVASVDGQISRVDLATGRVLREAKFGTAYLRDLVRIDGKRWLGVGVQDSQLAAYTFDDATLAATPLALGAEHVEGVAIGSGAVKLPDGTVAIGGPGLALAAWDPQTWKIKRKFSDKLGWYDLRMRGNQLVALSSARLYGFDLADGEMTEYGIILDVAAGRTVKRDFERTGIWVAEVRDGSSVLVRPRGDVVDAVLDDTHFYAVGEGLLRVFDLPSGRLALQVDLGWRSRASAHLAFDAHHIVLVMGAVVRVIDRDTGAITPAGPPPFEIPRQVRVSSDGTVAAIDDAAWRLRDGRVIAASDPRDHEDLELAPGDVSHYASYGGTEPVLVTVRAIGSAVASRHWQSKTPVLAGWLGKNAGVALEANDVPSYILLSHGGELAKVGAFADEARVADVDVDRGGALVTMLGKVWRVRLVDGSHDDHPMRAPGCELDPRALLERGGDRALTAADKDIYLWTRGRDEPIATMRVGDDADHATFVRGGEILFDFGTTLALWDPIGGTLRTLPLGTYIDAEASPDGKYVAIAFSDGRIALVELAILRRAMKVEPARAAPSPPSCPGADPFTLRPDDAETNDD